MPLIQPLSIFILVFISVVNFFKSKLVTFIGLIRTPSCNYKLLPIDVSILLIYWQKRSIRSLFVRKPSSEIEVSWTWWEWKVYFKWIGRIFRWSYGMAAMLYVSANGMRSLLLINEGLLTETEQEEFWTIDLYFLPI